ncbi:hypothetical protein QM565_19385 [Geitlerinema splendidum]|jgi:hypothetical protein|nr:hypothetical protein [Geitlerinema splendidum]
MKNIIGSIIILIVSFSFCPVQSDYVDCSEWDLSINPALKIQKIRFVLEGQEAGIEGLGFSQNRMTSAQFDEITASLDPEKYLNLKILNLNDNVIDTAAAPSLLKWLGLPSAPLINITGNSSISLKNISKLYGALGSLIDDPSDLKEKMKRVIFMSPQYITKAKSSVAIYNTHAEEGIIPGDWDQRHKSFYASEYFKRLQAQRAIDRLTKCMEGMKILATTPPAIVPYGVIPSAIAATSDASSQQQEGPDELSFEKAIAALTLNPYANE